MLTSNVTDVVPDTMVTCDVTATSVRSSDTSETCRSFVGLPSTLTVPASGNTPSPSTADSGRDTTRFVGSLSRTAIDARPSAQFST